jgi:hypothetical protein
MIRELRRLSTAQSAGPSAITDELMLEVPL